MSFHYMSLFTKVDVDPELVRQLRDINRALAGTDNQPLDGSQDDVWDQLLNLTQLRMKRITIVMYESAV